jgi:hypothetical protein
MSYATDVHTLIKAMRQQRREELDVNLSLLSRPTKVRAGTKTVYTYAPAVVTTNEEIEIGEAIRILGVFPGDTPEETTLRVISADDMDNHTRFDCLKEYYERDEKELCDCEKELSEMGIAFKEKVHYVLLSDIGK